jgi:hypothetical protein
MQNLKQTLLLLLLISGLFAACDNDEEVDPNLVTAKPVTMDAANERQANPVVSSATGNADVTYNKSTRMLNYTVSWQNLTDSITGSHIHGTATRAQNAGVKHGFTIPKTYQGGTYSGSVLVDGVSIKEDSLLAGFYYFNIHTKRYPGGEIRGQLEF